MSFTSNKTYGEYKHQLTINELPNHHHEAYSTVVFRKNGDGNVQSASNNSYWQGGQKDNTTWVGGNAKHNNISPCITVFFWQRIK